jgi:hypothetical protein
VSVAGFRARTNRRGLAIVNPVLGVPGSFAAMAHKERRRGRSAFMRFGGPVATRAATPRTPAR